MVLYKTYLQTYINIKQFNNVKAGLYTQEIYTDHSKRCTGNIYLLVLKCCKYADLKELSVSQFLMDSGKSFHKSVEDTLKDLLKFMYIQNSIFTASCCSGVDLMYKSKNI